jgi:hypothetical protein
MTIDHLPICIFRIIQKYLLNDEYMRLLTSSKQIQQEIGYETLYLQLNKDSSFKYYSKPDFRSLVEAKIKDKSKQLSITLSGIGINPTTIDEAIINGCHEVILPCFSTGFSLLSGISKIILFNAERMEGFPAISGLQHFTCYSYNLFGFRDVSSLSSLSSVTLVGCSVDDVSALKTCSKVMLYNCPNVKDITALSDVESLELNQCDNLRDISTLRNQNLKIISCSGIECFKSLKNCSNVTLIQVKAVDFNDVAQCKKLTLGVCPTINNLSSKHSLTSLTLSNVPMISDISIFSTLRYLEIDNCHGIEDISCLGNVRWLSISHCNNITSLMGLGKQNYSVSIAYCDYINDFSALCDIPVVSISYCEQFKNGNDVKNVQILSITGCPDFDDISMLGNIKQLSLSYLPKITHLKTVGNVSNLILQGLENLEDINGDLTAIDRIEISYPCHIKNLDFLLSHMICDKSISSKEIYLRKQLV